MFFYRTKEYSAALLDANKCVEIDPQWTKGFSRKGDALYALGRFTDAYNAYNSALRINPNDSTISSKRDQAQQAISNASASSGSSRAPRSTSLLATIQNYLRFVVVLSSILFLLPLGRMRITFYRGVIYSALLNYMLLLYQSHGFPKFNTAFLQSVMVDPTAMYGLYIVLI